MRPRAGGWAGAPAVAAVAAPWMVAVVALVVILGAGGELTLLPPRGRHQGEPPPVRCARCHRHWQWLRASRRLASCWHGDRIGSSADSAMTRRPWPSRRQGRAIAKWPFVCGEPPRHKARRAAARGDAPASRSDGDRTALPRGIASRLAHAHNSPGVGLLAGGGPSRAVCGL